VNILEHCFTDNTLSDQKRQKELIHLQVRQQAVDVEENINQVAGKVSKQSQ